MTESVKRAPLEDLMVAMDVVDTLRHRDQLVIRASDAAGRRESLLRQLRDVYAAQGIVVTDAMLEEGVKALEENRFSYEAPEKSFSTKLAGFYIKRRRFSTPFIMFAAILTFALVTNYFTEVRPAAAQREELPGQLQNTVQQIVAVSQDDVATQRAQSLLASARVAIAGEDYDEATATHQQLETMLEQLNTNYQIRIVSRPGEMSGAWRIPDINPNARNYYLIVEAVAADGDLVPLPITSEETGSTQTMSQWGIRVDEATFNAVGSDKQDDGIIQSNIVGSKQLGLLEPNYSIATTGGMITEW